MAKPDLILIALHTSDSLQLLERALSAAGYTTAVVHDRNELDTTVQEISPSLVFMGEHLQGEKGLQVAASLLERFPTLPILLFAENESPGAVKDALSIGVSGYLYPPLHTDDIVNAVRRALRRAQYLGDWVRREIKRTTASLEKRLGELETLVKLGRDITSTLDLNKVLNNVAIAAVELTGAEESSLLLLDETGKELYMRAGHNFEEGFASTLRLPIEDTLAGQVVQSGKPLVINDELKKIKTSYLIRALIYVPLRVKEHIIGVLGVDNRKRQIPFSEHDALLMSVLADYAAIAIENARLYQLSEAERNKFEATFTNIEDGVMILDEDGHILFVNQALQTAFGLKKEDMLGKAAREAISHPDLRTLLGRSSQDALNYHEINFDDERVFNAQYTPIPGVGSAITLQDISYLKVLDRMKNDFVHTVSHDLRSPLTAILGYTELVGRTGELNEQQLEFLQRIQSSVQNITILINDLLDLGRLEAGFDTRREVVKLDGILRYTLDNHQPQIVEKSLDLSVEISKNLPPLRGNPIRLRQMLDNLVGNAIKYTPKRGKVTVAIQVKDHQVILKVADSGPGIPASEQLHIFDKFFRASNIPDDIPGSGLGLTIVKSIVDSHQGRIWVESTEGQGSTFFVVLPAYEAAPQTALST
jgi:two-component system phosphate regulon sensor histidine kinase PhoR